jgi:hypothetical protein
MPATALAPLVILIVLAWLPPCVNAGDDGFVYQAVATQSDEVWVLVLEPTEAYGNTAPGIWIITEDVLWQAHVGEWYLVYLVILDLDEGDWAAAVREDDPEGIVVWLALDDRVEMLVDEFGPDLCAIMWQQMRCIGHPLALYLRTT